MKYTLGIDVGSSSVKVSLLNLLDGSSAATAFYPSEEMPIKAIKSGWAEQEPQMWWENTKLATLDVLKQANVSKEQIKAIGISYQMHGLVALDKDGEVVRPSIIWADSRAVPIGRLAFEELGEDYCLKNCLNSPGNFTASKLKWVKENEPELYAKIYKIMLPGDYIAYRLSGEMQTTVSGLSEGIMWDFADRKVADKLLEYYDISQDLLATIVDNFSEQSQLSDAMATELGLVAGTPITYRSGDQPNNAFSLNVLEPGEVAATAGTSGVIYGVSDKTSYDSKSRVNTFVHVNDTEQDNRLGVLLNINGTGILNSWLRRNVAEGLSYPEMNDLATSVPVGAEGLLVYPFGNGAERVLENSEPGARISGINFNIHNKAHVLRAAQEGIAFSFKYGADIMGEIGIDTKVVRAGNANMFLSTLFRQTLSNLLDAKIELYDTDGSLGAARGAAVGAKLYDSYEDAFANLKCIEIITPDENQEQTIKAYENWKNNLQF